MNEQFLDQLKQGWWLLLIRGIAAILFGLFALLMPGLTVLLLLISFGVFTLIDGIIAVVAGLRRKSTDSQWWVWLLEGLISVVIGLIVLVFPAPSAVAFTLWIAIWAVFAGIIRIMTAIRLRHQIKGEWALALGGVLLILWGVLMALLPAAGVLSLAWMIGSFAILIGITLCILAFRLRKLG